MACLIADWIFAVPPMFVGSILIAVVWQAKIRPEFLKRSEIEDLTDALIVSHGERAEEFAAMEEARAWHYSKGLEQGKWKRVRVCIQRRRQSYKVPEDFRGPRA